MKVGKLLMIIGPVFIASYFISQIIPQLQVCELCQDVSIAFLLIAAIGFLMIFSGAVIHFTPRKKTTAYKV